jgi:F0F1-type ATP synthase membrane subunit b/b'
MTATRKLVTVIGFTAVLFVAAFGTSFLAMKVAFADQAPRSDMGGSAAAHDPKAEHHEDPSKHFNFLGSPAEHYGKDAAGGPFGDGVNKNPVTGEVIPGEEHEMSAPFIFMVLNFILFLILLAWKAKPAFEKLAADRHDQIKTALDEAAKLRKQAADRLEEYQAKLAKADAEIKAMVDGMRADAEADKKRILENADRQAAQLQKDADARIAAEIQIARTTLTREVTYAATAAAEKLLKEKMTPSDQQQVINTFISGVQAAAQKEVR